MDMSQKSTISFFPIKLSQNLSTWCPVSFIVSSFDMTHDPDGYWCPPTYST